MEKAHVVLRCITTTTLVYSKNSSLLGGREFNGGGMSSQAPAGVG